MSQTNLHTITSTLMNTRSHILSLAHRYRAACNNPSHRFTNACMSARCLPSFHTPPPPPSTHTHTQVMVETRSGKRRTCSPAPLSGSVAKVFRYTLVRHTQAAAEILAGHKASVEAAKSEDEMNQGVRKQDATGQRSERVGESMARGARVGHLEQYCDDDPDGRNIGVGGTRVVDLEMYRDDGLDSINIGVAKCTKHSYLATDLGILNSWGAGGGVRICASGLDQLHSDKYAGEHDGSAVRLRRVSGAGVGGARSRGGERMSASSAVEVEVLAMTQFRMLLSGHVSASVNGCAHSASVPRSLPTSSPHLDFLHTAHVPPESCGRLSHSPSLLPQILEEAGLGQESMAMNTAGDISDADYIYDWYMLGLGQKDEGEEEVDGSHDELQHRSYDSGASRILLAGFSDLVDSESSLVAEVRDPGEEYDSNAEISDYPLTDPDSIGTHDSQRGLYEGFSAGSSDVSALGAKQGLGGHDPPPLASRSEVNSDSVPFAISSCAGLRQWINQEESRKHQADLHRGPGPGGNGVGGEGGGGGKGLREERRVEYVVGPASGEGDGGGVGGFVLACVHLCICALMNGSRCKYNRCTCRCRCRYRHTQHTQHTQTNKSTHRRARRTQH